MKSFSLLLISFFIFCSTPSFAQMEREEYSIYSQENFLENPGVVVGTITIRNPTRKRSKYRLIFSEKDHRKNGKTIITIRPKSYGLYEFQPDFWDGKKAVYVFVWRRNAGEYFFSNWHKWNAGNKANNIEASSFRVKDKMITYFGNIEINDREKTITRKDLKERDLPLIRKKYPDSNWDKYENGSIIVEAKDTQQ